MNLSAILQSKWSLGYGPHIEGIVFAEGRAIPFRCRKRRDGQRVLVDIWNAYGRCPSKSLGISKFRMPSKIPLLPRERIPMNNRPSVQEWDDFVSARRSLLKAIGAFGRLSPEAQATSLREALKSDQESDVMEYLRTVEDPTWPADLKVSPLLIPELGSIAAYPGENAPRARAYLENLAKLPPHREPVLAMADRRTADCFAHPEDEEIWMYTAEMLRAIDPERFDTFLARCRLHPSDKIRGVADFFET